MATTNNHEVDIYSGGSKYVFYRGIRALELNIQTLATYNVKRAMTLTEDRTISSAWYLTSVIGQGVQVLRDTSLIEKILFAPKGTIEEQFVYDKYAEVSSEFLETVRKNRRNLAINKSALELWKHKCPEEKWADWEDLPSSAGQMRELERAFALLAKLGVTMTRQDFKIVRGLGKDIMGLFVKDTETIYLAESTVDMGYRVIASTLYEEWLHKVEGLADESRSMQNYLFNKLLAMVEGASDEVVSRLPAARNEEEVPF